MPDEIQSGAEELPAVLYTLAGVLPQFTGKDLEDQLQTYDSFLAVLSPIARLDLATLLRSAAAKTTDNTARARIAAAADSIEKGGRAAEPYDHAKAMEEYTKAFKASYPANEGAESEPNPKPAPKPAVGVVPHKRVKAKREHPLLLAQLDAIEAEMKRISRWSDHPPEDFVAKVERGELTSFLEAPTFELWLQVVFLPNARKATLDDTLPKGSQVGEMARRQYDYMSVDYTAEELLALLQRFDALIDLANRGCG